EAQTWDTPIGSLLSNLNRIRYAIVHMSGEAWGTFSHSIAEIWAKFNASTGHKHSGAADDGGQVDHGTLAGLGDDDHTQYLRVDGARPYKTSRIYRDIDTSEITLQSGPDTGIDSHITLKGKNAGWLPGGVTIWLTNAAKTDKVHVLDIVGCRDDPYVDLRYHRVVNLSDPISAQDAATKDYVDSSAIARSGMILAWSGSLADIPSGWLLCDGSSGTPDLRDRFIVGAGSSYALGDTGGEATHTLTVDEIPSHTHNYQDSMRRQGT
ncbi:MAG: hypothetical protein JRD89_20020, partial [Deltaproteobacteria bacterium]|nr:hypothetical protein [Deltaproteobacteria bacterium]